jgi:plastocyanin
MRMPLRSAVPAATVALLASVLLASVLLAACGSQAVPTIPPLASGPPAVEPTPVGGSQAPGALIVALDIQFDPVELAVPAGELLTITLDNRDQGVPHDIVVRDANGSDIAASAIITGPAQVQLAVGPLEPGSYPFVCTVHPNMTGTITAK